MIGSGCFMGGRSIKFGFRDVINLKCNRYFRDIVGKKDKGRGIRS